MTAWSMPDPRHPYDSDRVRKLLDRMRVMRAEAELAARKPVRFRVSRDVFWQEVSRSDEVPLIAIGLPIALDERLPPNALVLEHQEEAHEPRESQ